MEEKLGRFTNVAKKDAGESIEIEKTTNYYTSTYCAAGIAVNSKFLKADNFDVKGHGVGSAKGTLEELKKKCVNMGLQCAGFAYVAARGKAYFKATVAEQNRHKKKRCRFVHQRG